MHSQDQSWGQRCVLRRWKLFAPLIGRSRGQPDASRNLLALTHSAMMSAKPVGRPIWSMRRRAVLAKDFFNAMEKTCCASFSVIPPARRNAAIGNMGREAARRASMETWFRFFLVPSLGSSECCKLTQTLEQQSCLWSYSCAIGKAPAAT